MIPLVKVCLPERDLLIPRLEEVLYSGVIGEGEYVYEFEKRFKEKFGLDSAIAMSSGTAALHAALVLAGVKPGDEVITTSMTAEPTNMAILHAGGVPVFADIIPNSGNLSPESIAEQITPRTRAIMVVHYAGIPVELERISALARRHGIMLIEDCAHALGAKYAGKSVGMHGDFSIFSFQAIKHMTTIDGGMLSLRDMSKLDQARKFRWFGLEKGVKREQSDIAAVGYKYNMTNIAATIGLSQLEHIDNPIQAHIENGRYYDQEFSKIQGLSGAAYEAVAEPSYWLYTLLSEDAQEVERILEGIGVFSSKLHKPNHLHSVFKPYSRSLPGLDNFYKRMTHIPCGWWVSREDRERIVHALKKG